MRPPRCRVCCTPLRADGTCTFRCDPALGSPAKRVARAEAPKHEDHNVTVPRLTAEEHEKLRNSSVQLEKHDVLLRHIRKHNPHLKRKHAT